MVRVWRLALLPLTLNGRRLEQMIKFILRLDVALESRVKDWIPLATSMPQNVHFHQRQIFSVPFELNLGSYISLLASISKPVANEFEGVEGLLNSRFGVIPGRFDLLLLLLLTHAWHKHSLWLLWLFNLGNNDLFLLFFNTFKVFLLATFLRDEF